MLWKYKGTSIYFSKYTMLVAFELSNAGGLGPHEIYKIPILQGRITSFVNCRSSCKPQALIKDICQKLVRNIGEWFSMKYFQNQQGQMMQLGSLRPLERNRLKLHTLHGSYIWSCVCRQGPYIWNLPAPKHVQSKTKRGMDGRYTSDEELSEEIIMMDRRWQGTCRVQRPY